MLIRFAILAGVSTDPQAREEKKTIPDQIRICRERMLHEGIETVEPFIIDGYSRTGYDSLDVAIADIPPLGDAIQAAQNDQYDVLVLDNFDRLGDLGLMINTRFKRLRKQLFSARQSGKLIAPELYDPYANESGDIDMYVEGIIHTYRINKIRRAWNIGVPERARVGLHPLSVPFGYRLAEQGKPALQIPAEIQLLTELKNLYLAGKPLQSLCDHANDSGVQPRRGRLWTRTVVKRMLLNRFYAGVTTFGKFKTIQGKRIPVPPSQWVTGAGQHVPIYDDTTWLAIQAETERRQGLRSRVQVYALSGLLTCSVCEQRLHRHGKIKYPVYLDCNHVPSHVQIEYQLALQLIAQKVVKELQARQTQPIEDEAQTLTARISDLGEQRQLVQAGYQSKIYSQAEAARRIVAIETDIDRLTLQRDRLAQRHEQQQQLLAFAQTDLTRIQHWIQHDDPATVNHFLTALCQTIAITPAYDLHITWR